MEDPPGLPKGRHAGVQFQSDFSQRKGMYEWLRLDMADGQWRVNSYGNRLEPAPGALQADPANKPPSDGGAAQTDPIGGSYDKPLIRNAFWSSPRRTQAL
jgi:hypothetical protein